MAKIADMVLEDGTRRIFSNLFFLPDNFAGGNPFYRLRNRLRGVHLPRHHHHHEALRPQVGPGGGRRRGHEAGQPQGEGEK